MKNSFKKKFLVLFLILAMIFTFSFAPVRVAHAGSALSFLTMGASDLINAIVSGNILANPINILIPYQFWGVSCVVGIICGSSSSGGVTIMPAPESIAAGQGCNYSVPITFYNPRMNVSYYQPTAWSPNGGTCTEYVLPDMTGMGVMCTGGPVPSGPLVPDPSFSETDRNVAIYRFSIPASSDQATLNTWFVNQIKTQVGNGWEDVPGAYGESNYLTGSESAPLVTLPYTQLCSGNVCTFHDDSAPTNSYVVYVAKILGNYGYSRVLFAPSPDIPIYLGTDLDLLPNKFFNKNNASDAQFPSVSAQSLGDAIVGPYQLGTPNCPIPYSCTGLPANANPFAAPDNTGLTVDTTYTYSGVGDTATKCEFNCNNGYTYNVVTNKCNNNNDGFCGIGFSGTGKVYPYNATGYGSDARCLTGHISDTAFPAVGGSATWLCLGTNGGGTSEVCSASHSHCNTGYTWNGTSCDLDLTMSGTLTASDCTIASGNSTCNTTLNWTTTNSQAVSSITTSPNITVTTGNTGSKTYSVGYGKRVFYLYNNALNLATAMSTSICASGTVWDGRSCAPFVNDWGPWSDCSASCGGGTQIRTCGGSNCSGSSSQSCNTEPCSIIGVCPSPATHYNCSTGTSINNINSPSRWTWTCAGLYGGASSSLCFEKKSPGYIEN
jgi:hypothetical protein